MNEQNVTYDRYDRRNHYNYPDRHADAISAMTMTTTVSTTDNATRTTKKDVTTMRNHKVQKELKRQGFYDEYSKAACAQRNQQYRERRLESKMECGISDPVPMLAENLAIAREKAALATHRREWVKAARMKVAAAV